MGIGKFIAGVCERAGTVPVGLLCNGAAPVLMKVAEGGTLSAALAQVGLGNGHTVPSLLIIAALGGMGLVNAIKGRRSASEVAELLDRLAKAAPRQELTLERIWEAVSASGVAVAERDKMELAAAVEACVVKQLNDLPDRILRRMSDLGGAIDLEDPTLLVEIQRRVDALAGQVANVETRLTALLGGIAADAAGAHTHARAAAENTAAVPGIDERTRRMEADIARLASGGRPRTNVPTNLPDPSPRFTARARAMIELHALIQSSGQAGLGQAAALWADGGVGKTMLAEHYGWLHLNDYPGGVFKIAADAGSLVPALAALAPDLGVERVFGGDAGKPRPEPDVAADVRARLESRDSLLILDNVPDAARWADPAYLAPIPKGRCRHLVTTRAEYLDGVEMQRLDVFSPDEGAAVLARHRKDAADPANSGFARDVSAWFGGLGAGLLVVGVYMALNPRLSWGDYAKDLGARGLAAARDTHALVVDKVTYKQRFDTAFDRAVESLSPHERRALEYAALLSEDMVPVPWLLWLVRGDNSLPPQNAPPGYTDVADHAVGHLRSLGLLRDTQTHSQVLTLHRVLRVTTRERMDASPDHVKTLRSNIAACAAARRATIIGSHPDGSDRGTNDPAALTDQTLRWELAPLAAVCTHLWAGGQPGDAARVGVWLASVLQRLGRFAEAAGCLLPVRGHEGAVENALGAGGVASCYSNLAGIQQDQGDLPRARASMERAIAIDQKHFPPDHPTFATNYSNLAMIQQDQGDLPGARASMERAIAIDQKHFPPDHPNFATRYNNLAHICKAEGNHTAACANWAKALAILLKHFDENHPHVKAIRRSMKAAGCGG